MEDKHLIADIIAKRLEETPKMDSVVIDSLIEDSGLPAYKVDRAIRELADMCVLEYNKAETVAMITSKFVHGYKYNYKRLYYDKFDGKSLYDKIQKLGFVTTDFRNGYHNDIELCYVLGRVDQNCFSVEYL